MGSRCVFSGKKKKMVTTGRDLGNFYHGHSNTTATTMIMSIGQFSRHSVSMWPRSWGGGGGGGAIFQGVEEKKDWVRLLPPSSPPPSPCNSYESGDCVIMCQCKKKKKI